MRLLKLIILITLTISVFIIGALFVADNPELVDVRFYRWQLSDISISLLLLGFFAIGLLVGLLATIMWVAVLKSKLMLLKRQLSSVEKERDKLRLLGLKE
jgi:uncharacterized membrane protein YciS (DUF1049 family)